MQHLYNFAISFCRITVSAVSRISEWRASLRCFVCVFVSFYLCFADGEYESQLINACIRSFICRLCVDVLILLGSPKLNVSGYGKIERE